MSSPHPSSQDSTAITPPSTPPPTPNAHDLSDVFSDSPPQSPSTTAPATDPSDIPRLRSAHFTAGYREGATAAKEKTLQPGFDEGYSLGATFGLRIGCLLGELEGVYTALKGSGSTMEKEAERVAKLYRRMRNELALEKVFGREWWGENGLWKYEVRSQRGENCNEEGKIIFKDVVESHPLVVQWHVVIEREVDHAAIQRGRFEGEGWEKGRVED